MEKQRSDETEGNLGYPENMKAYLDTNNETAQDLWRYPHELFLCYFPANAVKINVLLIENNFRFFYDQLCAKL